jgi:glycosyltransferase involved in cell wall biosynthesis
MVRYLAKQGHHVTVLTEFPNHPAGIIPPEYRGKIFTKERFHGVDVVRTWVFTRAEKSFWVRIAFYLSFCFMAIVRGIGLRGSFDVVYATSPPLFVGLSGFVISAWKRTKFMLEIRDLWPESAVALGELSNRLFIRLAEALEAFLYRRACRVVGVSRGINEGIRERHIPREKILFIPNGANIGLYTPGKKNLELRRRWGIPDSSFVVMFTGLHGLMHGLEFVVETARLMQAHDDVWFAFIGEGVVKSRLIRMTESYGLKQIRFLDAQPEEDLPEYIRTFDAGLVSRKRMRIAGRILPVKMFTYMACEKPIIACIEEEPLQVVLDAGAGLYSEPQNPDALMHSILHLKNKPGLCRKMGKRGREYVMEHFSRTTLAGRLEQSLLEVVGHTKRVEGNG